jgi:hypothetical protein
MEYRTVSTRLSVDKFTLVKDYCTRNGINPSTLIKELILDEIGPSIPANIAGRNIFEYDKKKDSFSWCIELDTRERVIVLKSISAEYMRDLYVATSNALTSRNELQNRKRKNSVPVPKKLIKGRK